MSVITIYRKNGQYLRVKGLKRGADNSPVNDATVTATLTLAELPVAGFETLALEYVAGSNGDYEGLIPASFDARVGTNYVCKIDITAPGLAASQVEVKANVVRRTV